MPATSPADKKAASVPASSGAFAKSLRTVLVGTIGAGALMYVAVSLMAPRYTAEARLALMPKGKAGELLAAEVVQRQARAAHSPEIAGDIATQLKLAERPEFNRTLGFPDTWSKLLAMAGLSAAPTGTEKEQVRAAVLQVSEVAPLADVGQLAVRFRATDPELAAKGANAIAAAYIASLGQTAATEPAAAMAPAPIESDPAAAAAPALKDLTQRLTVLNAEVAAYENEKARLIAEAQQKAKPAAPPAAEARSPEVVAELSRAKAQRVEAEAALKAAREAVKSSNVDALAELQKSPSVQTLLQERVRLERQITELSASLLPEHPRMQQLNAKLASFKREIALAMAKSVEKLERDAKAAQAREDSLAKSLTEATAAPAAMPQPQGNDLKLKQIETALADRRAEVERLKAEAAAADKANAVAPQQTVAVPVTPASTGAQAIEAKIITPATAAGLAPLPDKTKLAALAAILTFGAGMILAVLRSLFASLFGRAARPAVPARKLPAKLVETATAEKVAAKAHPPALPPTPAAPVAPAAVAPTVKAGGVAAAVAAIGAKLGKGSAKGSVKVADTYEPPVSPPEPRAVSQAATYELEGEAHCDAVRLDEIAARALARPVGDIGIRSLVTGADDTLDPEGEALGLARRLVAAGKSVVLVGWSPSGIGLAEFLGISAAPGLNEMLIGRATFEDVVQCLLEIDGHELHAIPAGEDVEGKTDALDPDVVNLVLDALDEVYDHIVVVGAHEEAKDLFEAILGRFDIGVVVHDAAHPAETEDDTFLGFEVTDIETMTCVRPPLAEPPAPMPPPSAKTAPVAVASKPVSSPSVVAAPAADEEHFMSDPEAEPDVEPSVMMPAVPVKADVTPAGKMIPPPPAKASAASKVSDVLARVGKKAPVGDDKPAPISQTAIARALRSTSSGRSAAASAEQSR